MTEFTQWDSGSLSQGAADLRLAYRGIEDELNDLEKALEAKLDLWEGDAKQAYWDAKAQWEQGTRELNNILERLGVAVTDIESNYSATERANQGIFGG